MELEIGSDRLRRELLRAFDRMRTELDRIEILSTALAAFANPVPDYEPRFQHLRNAAAPAHELAQDGPTKL